MSYYLEDQYKADPSNPIQQSLSIRRNFKMLFEKLNNTMAVVNNLVIRNNMVYTYIESVDDTNPFVIDFLIPSNAVLVSAKLSLKGIPFRAYSKAASSGGGSTSGSGGGTSLTSGINGRGHVHQITINDESIGANYYAVYVYQSGATRYLAADSGQGQIRPYIGPESQDHTHNVSISNHTHSTPNHTHDLTFGIYESTTPNEVKGFYDNGSGFGTEDSYGNAPDTTTPWNIKSEYNITDKFSRTGWKRIKLESSRLGKFNILLIIELDITPTA